MVLGGEAITEALPLLEAGKLVPEKQDDTKTCYAALITKAMGKLDFTRSAKELHDQIRGMNPWPGCHCAAGGKALKIHESRLAEGHGKPGELIALDPVTVACGEGAVQLLHVVPEGKKPMDGTSFAAGLRLKAGDSL